MPFAYGGLHPVEHDGTVIRPGEIRDEPIAGFGPWTEVPPGDGPLPLDVPPGDPAAAPEPPAQPAPPAAPAAPAAPPRSASAPKRSAEGEK